MIDDTRLLSSVPAGLRVPLIESYQRIVSNFSEHRWEPSELNGGKFCEAVFSIVDGVLRGALPTAPSKPRNMVDACRALEQVPKDANRVGDESLRKLIPRILLPLYEIRNNRGVGHVGGDVDPNFLDATAVLAMSSWLLAELVRIFHGVSTEEAQASVDALVERKHPLIWHIGDVRRVLDVSLTASDQVLVFLHQHAGWVTASDLLKWIEYRNPTDFRNKVLKKLHTKRFIEFDRASGRAQISPLGVDYVETKILDSRKPN